MNVLANFFSSTASIIGAIVLIVIAFAAAKVMQIVVVKALKRFKAEEFLQKTGIKDVETKSSIQFFGKLVFIIVFLVFLPSIFSRLGMTEISSPINSIVYEFVAYIPKIIIAGIILFIGLNVAKIIRQLTASLLERCKIDTLQTKLGVSEDSTKLSGILSYIIYIIALIPIVTASLQILDISAITTPILSMLNKIFDMIPNIFIAIAIVIVGFYIAKAVGTLVKSLLSGTGFDAAISKLFTQKTVAASAVIGESIKYIILVLFIVEALSALNLNVLSGVGNTILAYFPDVIATVIILGAALFISNWVKDLILKKNSSAVFSAQLVKILILTVSVFMSLSQLQIAPAIVNTAFIIILSAVALAFALAVGLGGKEYVSNFLKRNEIKTKLDDMGNKISDAFKK